MATAVAVTIPTPAQFYHMVLLHGPVPQLVATQLFCSLRNNIHIGLIGENLAGGYCHELFNNKLNFDVIDQAIALCAIIYVRQGL
jgi:hypothetical protein